MDIKNEAFVFYGYTIFEDLNVDTRWFKYDRD